MDLITHFLVPYAILTLLRSKNRLAGAFGGISLDFDVLIAWIGILSPELFIFSHRGITHSFIFGFITSVLFLYVITRRPVKDFVGKAIRRDLPLEFNRASVMVVYFGALTHLFLDFLTSKGIPLLYPLTITRYSAELYYYLDAVTIVIAVMVLVILYPRLDLRYKKVALTSFMIILILFGGVRAYEKLDVLQQAETFNNKYTNISAYPTPDMFTWSVVESSPQSTVEIIDYHVFEYNNLEKSAYDVKSVPGLTVKNGSYISALKAIKTADDLPQIERFKWNSYYSCIDAEHSSEWKLTYFDLLNSSSGSNGLTVYEP